MLRPIPPILAAALTAAWLLAPAGPGLADMSVKLKDGRVLSLPVQREEVEGITFTDGVGASPASRAAERIRSDAERVRSADEAAARAEDALRKAEAAARAAQEAAAAAQKAQAEAREAGTAARTAADEARRAARQPPVSPDLARPAVRAAQQKNGGNVNGDGNGDAPRVLTVGPGRLYSLPSQAAKIARNGDTIEIQAGTYNGDVAVWHASNLVIRGVGGRVRLLAGGRSAQGKAIWVLAGENTLVQNVEFTGAHVPDRNGAGIRLEGAGLIVRHCRFYGNEIGILTGSNPRSDVLIEHSEFFDNKLDPRRASDPGHNIYIGVVRSFTLRYSHIHHAVDGHNVKSRALRSVIAYNRIEDGADGAASYQIDLPNGGYSVVIGNVLQQGRDAENWALINYGTVSPHPDQTLLIASNTFVNDRSSGVFVSRRTAGRTVMVNNIFAGNGRLLNIGGDIRNNLVSRRQGAPSGNVVAMDPGFVDRVKGDYRLRAGSAAVDAAIDPGLAGDTSLTPVSEYADPLGTKDRAPRGRMDIGAFEFTGE